MTETKKNVIEITKYLSFFLSFFLRHQQKNFRKFLEFPLTFFVFEISWYIKRKRKKTTPSCKIKKCNILSKRLEKA